jgi:hypothetical protein
VTNMVFRPYRASEKQAGFGIFDANCSVYFTPNERSDYEKILESALQGHEICERDSWGPGMDRVDMELSI